MPRPRPSARLYRAVGRPSPPGGAQQRALSSPIRLSARRKPTPRSPDKQASLERRRRQAASGAMPPALAARFTTGELAALTVIARQCQRGGACSLPIDALAALAGVSRTTVQNALRAAKALGLIFARERRRPGLPSLTNVLRVISPEWAAWLKLSGREGGFRNLSATNKAIPKRRRAKDDGSTCPRRRGWAGDRRQRHPSPGGRGARKRSRTTPCTGLCTWRRDAAPNRSGAGYSAEHRRFGGLTSVGCTVPVAELLEAIGTPSSTENLPPRRSPI
jgi:hypothetical protein